MPRTAARLPAVLRLACILFALAGLIACERQESWQVVCAGPKEPIMNVTMPADAPLTVPAIDRDLPAATETATFALG